MGLEQILSFNWNLAIGSQRISEDEFALLCKKAGSIVLFRNQFVYVDPNEIGHIAKRLQLGTGPVNGRRLIAAALNGKFGEDNVLLSKELKAALEQLLAEKEIAVSPDLNAKLHPYQERGFSWLVRNLKASMGSIIADDMGLGKTMQVIAALDKLRYDGVLAQKGALIVVPKFLLVNWKRELSRFAAYLQRNLRFQARFCRALRHYIDHLRSGAYAA